MMRIADNEDDSDYEVGFEESDDDSTDSDDEDHGDSCENVLRIADNERSGRNSHGTLFNEGPRGDLRREEAFDDDFSDAFSDAFSDEGSDNGFFDEDSSEESSDGDAYEEGLADNNESSDEDSSDGGSDETDGIQAKDIELVFFDLKVPHRQPTVSLLNHDTQREALSEMMRIATIFLDTTIADKNIAAINVVNLAWMVRAGRADSTIRKLRIEAAIFHKHPIIPSPFGAVYKSMTPHGTPFRRNRCLSQLDFTFRPDAVCHYTVSRIHEDGLENQGFPDEKWLPVLNKIAKKAAKTLERIIRIHGGHFGLREFEILWKWMLNQKSYAELATSPFEAVDT